MGVKMINHTERSKYCFRRKGGRSIVDYRPVFSPDGKFLLIITQNIVKVHDIHTGDCVRILETENEVDRIVSVQFPHNEDYNLYGCCENGCVTIWTWEKGAVLREKKLQLEEDFKVLTFDMLDSNVCVVTALHENNQKLCMTTFSLKTGEVVQQFELKDIKYYQIWTVAIGWSKEQQRFAAICNGSMSIEIFDLARPNVKIRHSNGGNIRFVSVAAHPTESCVVASDALGRATVFRGNLFDRKNVAKEVLHWHSLPLMSVAFSLQGSYLLSGGMEKVLVKWSLGNLANKAREQQFLPRLPAAIRYIATNNVNVALTLTNNSVVIISAQMHLLSTVLECGGLSKKARAMGLGLVFHRPLGALLLGGRTGHLQLYSTSSDKILYNVDITGLNNIPATRQNLIPTDTELTCAAVSADGSWLATSEYRNDGVTYPEERLKFWSANISGSTPFLLNTCVNLSHGGCQVTSLAINNTGEFCVSAGTDQKFRIWKKEQTSQSHRKQVAWSCLTACYYSSGVGASLTHTNLNCFKANKMLFADHTEYSYLRQVHKDDVIRRVLCDTSDKGIIEEDIGSFRTKEAQKAEVELGGVAISQDGSLIAAWFGSKLTLWDTHLCELRTTLSHPSLRPKGVDVRFGNEDAAHYLVCTTEHCVGVWSLLSQTIRWLVHISPATLTADPFSNKMAVVTENNDVFVFTPHSSTPLFSLRAVLDPSAGVVRHCAFGLGQGQEDFRLYMMRNDSEIYCLEPEDSDDSQLSSLTRANLPTSNFSALMAEQQLSGVQAQVASTDIYLDSEGLGKTALAQFFSAAPHMVPPVSLLCTSFLEHISGHKESDIDAELIDEPMEIEEHSSSDEEEDVTHKSSIKPDKVELWVPNYEEVKEKKLKKIAKEIVLPRALAGTLLAS